MLLKHCTEWEKEWRQRLSCRVRMESQGSHRVALLKIRICETLGAWAISEFCPIVLIPVRREKVKWHVEEGCWLAKNAGKPDVRRVLTHYCVFWRTLLLELWKPWIGNQVAIPFADSTVFTYEQMASLQFCYSNGNTLGKHHLANTLSLLLTQTHHSTAKGVLSLLDQETSNLLKISHLGYKLKSSSCLGTR